MLLAPGVLGVCNLLHAVCLFPQGIGIFLELDDGIRLLQGGTSVGAGLGGWRVRLGSWGGGCIIGNRKPSIGRYNDDSNLHY